MHSQNNYKVLYSMCNFVDVNFSLRIMNTSFSQRKKATFGEKVKVKINTKDSVLAAVASIMAHYTY